MWLVLSVWRKDNSKNLNKQADYNETAAICNFAINGGVFRTLSKMESFAQIVNDQMRNEVIFTEFEFKKVLVQSFHF